MVSIWRTARQGSALLLASLLAALPACRPSPRSSQPPAPVAPPKAQAERFAPPPQAKKKRHHRRMEGTPGGLMVPIHVISRTRHRPVPSGALVGRVVSRPARAIPRLHVASPQYGSPYKASISRVMKTLSPQIQYCYVQALTRRPSIQGRLLVRFIIDTAGQVPVARIKQSLGDKILDSCILRIVRSARFPRPRGGRIIVSYPFLFKPSP